MKTKILLLCAATFVSAAFVHAEKVTAGPKGGRLLESEPQKAEFFVNPERKVEIRFYDAQLKPVAPGTQVVTLIAEPASGRVPLELEKTGEFFLSKTPLPPGEPYRVVVQVRPAQDTKPKNFRVDLNLAHCGGCNLAEYACTCEGH